MDSKYSLHHLTTNFRVFKMKQQYEHLEDLPDDDYEECVAYGFDDGGVYGFCEED